jgi:hypothetical protein
MTNGFNGTVVVSGNGRGISATNHSSLEHTMWLVSPGVWGERLQVNKGHGFVAGNLARIGPTSWTAMCPDVGYSVREARPNWFQIFVMAGLQAA